jgi:2,3-bisphosphoglycerate-independent phosphoglycerate mutase
MAVSSMRYAGGWRGAVTADHGNVEMMHDDTTGQPHTAHTRNLVPCLYVGRSATMSHGGSLQDIAPTLLSMMGLLQPREMTGRSLIQVTAESLRLATGTRV